MFSVVYNHLKLRKLCLHYFRVSLSYSVRRVHHIAPPVCIVAQKRQTKHWLERGHFALFRFLPATIKEVFSWLQFVAAPLGATKSLTLDL